MTAILALLAPASAVISIGSELPPCVIALSIRVYEHTLQQPPVGLDRRKILGHADLDGPNRLRVRKQGARDRLIERHDLGLDAHLTGLQAARVQQVVDDSGEPVDGVLNCREQLLAFRRWPIHVPLAAALI